MKKIFLLVGLFIICMILSTGNLYAACNISNGKIEVSKGGACQSIQSAIDKADGVNPVLISVLPGTYTEQITMKPYVTLAGSGQENTKVTSSADATVRGADYSAIENIWIENSLGAGYRPSAILNDNTSMRISNVKILTKVPASGANEAYGILITGVNSNTIVADSRIYVENSSGGRGSIGIGIKDGSNVTIANSTVDVNVSVAALWGVGIYSSDGFASVQYTVVKVEGAQYNYGLDIHSDINISNSSIEAIAGDNTIYNTGLRCQGSACYATNSRLVLTGSGSAASDCAVDTNSVFGAKIGASLIQGDICGGINKIVNS